MEKKQFVQLMDERLKLIRTEFKLTQENMSAIIGISKKTLIEIEKGRKSMGWTCAVAFATIFSGSRILRDTMGDDIPGFIIAVAFKDLTIDHPKTMGGKVWWKTISLKNNYRIQQNMFSRHYRLLDPENHRLFSTFNINEMKEVALSYMS